MKWLIGVGLVLGALFAYWEFNVHQKTKFLLEFSKPFHAACQTSACVLAPEGWIKERGEVYARERMEYIADQDKFMIIWHIGTDVFLVARGGRGKEVTVEKVVEYPGPN